MNLSRFSWRLTLLRTNKGTTASKFPRQDKFIKLATLGPSALASRGTSVLSLLLIRRSLILVYNMLDIPVTSSLLFIIL